MAEYIERKALKYEMTEAMCGTGYQQWAIDVIDRLPTVDAVEIVRCKDCKHYLNDTPYCQSYRKGYCEWDNMIKPKHHFCSRGERKEGAT